MLYAPKWREKNQLWARPIYRIGSQGKPRGVTGVPTNQTTALNQNLTFPDPMK